MNENNNICGNDTLDDDDKLTWDEESVRQIHDTLSFEEADIESQAKDMLLSNIFKSFPKEQQLNSSLKKWFSRIILGILIILTLSIICIVIFTGLKYLDYSEWTLRLFITGVFVEIIAVVRIIVSSLFPKDDRKVYLDFINDCANSKAENKNHKEKTG